jgi:hypothetical protein
VTDYESISVSINGAGSQADFNSDDIGAISNYSGRMAVLTAGGANARYANVSTTRSSYDFTCTAMRLIYEQDIAIFDVTVGDYKIGLTDSATALTNFCGLRHLHTDTDWILSTALGTFTVPSSAPTDAVIQHFVIVYSGADTPEGIANSNTALIRVYLNGVLKLTQSGAFLATGNEYIIQDARATGAGGAFAIVGGWTLRWNAY